MSALWRPQRVLPAFDEVCGDRLECGVLFVAEQRPVGRQEHFVREERELLLDRAGGSARRRSDVAARLHRRARRAATRRPTAPRLRLRDTTASC